MRPRAPKKSNHEELKRLAFNVSVLHSLLAPLGEMSRQAATLAADLRALSLDPSPERVAAIRRSWTKMGDPIAEFEAIVAPPSSETRQ
jgi:hypothetical protein